MAIEHQNTEIQENLQDTAQFLDEHYAESVSKLRDAMGAIYGRLREDPDTEPYEEVTIGGRQIMVIYDEDADEWSAMDADRLRNLYLEQMTGRVWSQDSEEAQ
jgi:hypothetical protein